MFHKTFQKLFVLMILSTIVFVLGTTVIFWLIPYYDISGQMTSLMVTYQWEIILFCLSFAVINVARVYNHFFLSRMLIWLLVAGDISVVIFLLMVYIGIDTIGFGVVVIVVVLLSLLFLVPRKFFQYLFSLLLVGGVGTIMLHYIPLYPYEIDESILLHHQSRYVILSGLGPITLNITDDRGQSNHKLTYDQSIYLLGDNVRSFSWFANSGSELVLLMKDGRYAMIPSGQKNILTGADHPAFLGQSVLYGDQDTILPFSSLPSSGWLYNTYYMHIRETIRRLYGRKYADRLFIHQLAWYKIRLGLWFFPNTFRVYQNNYLLYQYLMGGDMHGMLPDFSTYPRIAKHLGYQSQLSVVYQGKQRGLDNELNVMKDSVSAGSHGLRYFQYFFGLFD